ncbi:MAG: metal ABC transporter substrate-binding protein [Myxococcota bacterium]|nr:metal ABC transporter substrate-binding protein [Myxococcota bacterium]
MRTLCFWICLALSLSAHAKVKVVATVSDLGAIAREVGGAEVDVQLLAAPTQDPHFVDAKPSLVLLLSRADLLLLNGMELEVGWLPTLITSSRNQKVQRGAPGYLDGSTLVTAKEIPPGKLDRAMGDIHPGGNPHYTKDPANAVALARGIAQRLGQLDPPHAQDYQQRADAFAAQTQQKVAAWKQALAPYKGTPVVPYHRSWIYFTEFAGLEEVAFVEPKPGIPPSSAHVAAVLGVIRRRGAKVLLQEEWYPAGTSELLARTSGARLVRVPGMTPVGATYLGYFDQLVTATVNALAPR